MIDLHMLFFMKNRWNFSFDERHLYLRVFQLACLLFPIKTPFSFGRRRSEDDDVNNLFVLISFQNRRAGTREEILRIHS